MPLPEVIPGRELTPRMQQAFDLVARYPGLSSSRLALHMQIRSSTAGIYLDALRKGGLIEPGLRGWWIRGCLPCDRDEVTDGRMRRDLQVPAVRVSSIWELGERL
jgi:hypothetical protein